MARTPARLPNGTRLSDYVTLGVLTTTVPAGLIDAVLADTGRQSRRQRSLPARLVVYYVMALALYGQASYGEVLRCLLEGVRWLHRGGTSLVFATADSSSVANTTSAQGAGEVDAEATTEADSGRPGRDRSAAERRLGRAGDRAGAWPFTQRDQYGDWARSGTGRLLRRRAGTGRGGSAVGPVGTPGQAGAGQPAVCRGGESAAAAVVAGADRRETQASGGWN